MEHNIGRLYTLERRLNNISKDESRQMKAVTESVQDFVNWKKQARHQLELLLSLQRFDEVSLRPELLESFETKKYIYEQIVIQTERDVELPLSFFAPKKNKKEKCPIVLYFCGNYIKKTESASPGDFDYIKKSLDKQDNSFIVRLVKQGYAVAVVDTGWKAGKIEVTGKADSDKSNTVMLHERLSKIALTLGYSLSGMNVWDGIKVIDYLQIRKEFDGRLYCGGESDGGMTSLYLAAIDERIKGSFVSSCFYGVQNRILQQPDNFIYDYIPDLWRYFDISDIAAMLAPRPLFIEYGNKQEAEKEESLETAYKYIREIKKAYKILNAEANLQYSIFYEDNKKAFCGEEVIRFLNTIQVVKSQHSLLAERYVKETLS